MRSLLSHPKLWSEQLEVSVDLTAKDRRIHWGKLLLEDAATRIHLQNPAFFHNEIRMASPLRQYATYEHIPHPTFEEMRVALCIFDQIALHTNLPYACVGSFVARLNGGEQPTYDLELLVEANDLGRLEGIMWTFPNYLAKTEGNHHIVVIRENRGIALQFSTTGNRPDNYTARLIPPRACAQGSAHHVHPQPEATIHYQRLGYLEADRQVPVLSFRLLLQQRLLRFKFDPVTYREKKQNERDSYDIVVFLKCTKRDKEPSFPCAEARVLLPVVKKWIMYAEKYSILTNYDDVNEWRRLGLDLRAENVSGRLRGGMQLVQGVFQIPQM